MRLHLRPSQASAHARRRPSRSRGASKPTRLGASNHRADDFVASAHVFRDFPGMANGTLRREDRLDLFLVVDGRLAVELRRLDGNGIGHKSQKECK